MPDSEALYGQLATEEATVKRLRAEIGKARPAQPGPVAIDKAKARASIARFLDAGGSANPEQGREILARVVTPITVVRNDTTPGAWRPRGRCVC
jgi:hypothetical protein